MQTRNISLLAHTLQLPAVTFVTAVRISTGKGKGNNIVRVIKSRIMRWAGHVTRMEQGRDWYEILVGKPEGKRPLGRPRGRREDNIRMDLQEVGSWYEDWIGLAQDRDRWPALVSAVRNLRVP
jgi:hypothetical protein